MDTNPNQTPHKQRPAISRHMESFVLGYVAVILRLRKHLLPLVLLPVLLMSTGWYYFHADLSTEGLLFETDPAIRDYFQVRAEFGASDRVIVSVQAKAGSDVFDLEYLHKLYQFQQAVQQRLPFIDKLDSLINATNVQAISPDELQADDLLPGFPEQMDWDMDELRRYVLNEETYRNLLVTEDGKASALMISLGKDSPPVAASSDSAASAIDDLFSDEADDLTSELPGDSDADIDALFEQDAGEGTQDLQALDSAASQSKDWHSAVDNKLNNAEYTRVYRELSSIIQEFNSPDFKIHVAGFPILEPALFRFLLNDAYKTLILVISVIMVLLLLLLRRKQALLPLPIIGMTLLSTGGVMFATGTPLTIVSMVMPPILVAITVGSGIHLLSNFFRLYDSGMERDDALRETLCHCFVPILMTSLTTAGGMASFLTSPFKPIHDFGIFGAFGVLISMVFTLSFIPVVLSFVSLRRRALPTITNQNKVHKVSLASGHDHFGHLLARHNVMDSFLHWCSGLAYHKPWRITLLAFFSVVGAVYSALNVKLHHRPLTWLPQYATIRQDTTWIDANFRGSNIVNVVVDSGVPGGIFEPDFLQRVAEFENYALQYDRNGLHPGAVLSVTSLYRKINMVLNGGDEAQRRLPSRRDLAAQEMLLFENGGGSDDLGKQVDTQRRKVSIIIKVPDLDAILFADYVSYLEDYLSQTFPSERGEKTVITGGVMLLVRIIRSTLLSMLRSYGIAMIVITLMMMMFLRSVWLGLLSMLPNFIPIFVMISAMTLLGIDLDLFITMTGSLILGLAVDDTIHFMSTYIRLHRDQGYQTKEAILVTLTSSGRAMTVTSIILVGGFSSFLLGSMNNLKHFAILSSIAIATALLCDLLFTPALITLMGRYRLYRTRGKNEQSKTAKAL